MSKSIIKNSFFSVLKSFSSIVFPVITYSYVSRILLADGMGKIVFSKSYITYFVLLAMLGVNNYGIRECARVRDNREQLSKLSRELLTINIASTVASYIMLFATVYFVDFLDRYFLLLLLFSMEIGLASIGMEWLYIAVEDYKYIAVRSFAFQLLSFVFMFLFVKDYDDIYIYAVIQVAAMSGSKILNFVHARKYIHLRRHRDLEYLSHLKPIAILFLMLAFTQIFTVLSTTILGFLTNDRVVGLYGASRRITGAVASFINSITLVLAPRISYYAEKNRMHEVKSIIEKAGNLILMLCIPIVLGFVLLSEQFLIIFSGSDFLEANVTAKISALGELFVPLNTFIFLHLFVSLKKEKWNLISVSITAVSALVLYIILIPRFEANGAAWATVFAELIELIVNLYFLSKMISVTVFSGKLWQYLLASVGIVISYFVFSALINNIYFMTIMTIAASSVIYFAVLIVLKNSYVLEIFEYAKKKGKQYAEKWLKI